MQKRLSPLDRGSTLRQEGEGVMLIPDGAMI